LIFVTVKCGVLFEVRTEFLNIIYTNFILPLSEWRAGKTWEPANKTMPVLPPEINCMSLRPNNFFSVSTRLLLSFLTLPRFRFFKRSDRN
jgi:hypothetical protein